MSYNEQGDRIMALDNYERIIREIMDRVGAGIVDRVGSLEWDEGTPLPDVYSFCRGYPL